MVRLLGVFACAVFLTMAGVGCAGSSPESTSTTAEADSARRTLPDSTQRTPSPGTARVRARVDSCSSTASPPTCQIEVLEVLAYGMATPTIGTPQSMTVQMPNPGEENDGPQLRSGEEYMLVLGRGQKPQFEDAAASGPSWAIVDVQ